MDLLGYRADRQSAFLPTTIALHAYKTQLAAISSHCFPYVEMLHARWIPRDQRAQSIVKRKTKRF